MVVGAHNREESEGEKSDADMLQFIIDNLLGNIMITWGGETEESSDPSESNTDPIVYIIDNRKRYIPQEKGLPKV